MVSPIKYHIAEDGVSIWVESGARALKQVKRSDHLYQTRIVPPAELFNRGVRRGATILVTGDRPRFALMTTLPEDSSSPDLIKLGDGRIRVSCQGTEFWLDECSDIYTVFHPGSTEYTLGTSTLPGVTFHLLVSQAQTWGLVARLSVTNQRAEPVSLVVEFVYGGLGRHGRTWQPAYFLLDPDDGQSNRVDVVGGAVLLRDGSIPCQAGVTMQPTGECTVANVRACYTHTLCLDSGTARPVYLVAAHAGSAEGVQRRLAAAQPEDLIQESHNYYTGMLAEYAITTPSQVLDLGFRTSVWNLDSVYVPPAWLEGVHWWAAYWTNLFQVSAATALGQLERARGALEMVSQQGYGMLMASGKAGGWPPPDVLYYYPYDGLFYYMHALFQYHEHIGDAGLVERMWPSLTATLEQVLTERDAKGHSLLSWRLGCNAFLYQADQLGMPGDAASPSLMAAGMVEQLAGLAHRLGKTSEAEKWQQVADRMMAEIPARLWNCREGAFYNHIDLQDLCHMAHYYTDLVFPTLYTHLPQEYGWQSLAHLRQTLCYQTGHADAWPNLTLMRVGDLQPTMFGNDSVLPAQMAEAARAYFKSGDQEMGLRLLEAVALAGTLFTESPGNFPERMDFEGKGEFNYLFGNPIGSFAYAVVAGLFGLSIADGGKTLVWTPGFPTSWEHAELRLPYCSVAYRRLTRDGQVVRRYRVESEGRQLSVTVFLEPCRIGQVTCNGEPITYKTAPGLGKTRLEFSLPGADLHEFCIEYTPLPLIVEGPAEGVPGEPVRWVLPAPISQLSDPQGLLADLQIAGREASGTVQGGPGQYQLLCCLDDLQLIYPITFVVKPACQVLCPSAVYAADLRAVRLTFNLTLRRRSVSGYRLQVGWLDQQVTLRLVANETEELAQVVDLLQTHLIPEGAYDVRYAVLDGDEVVCDGHASVTLKGADEAAQVQMEATRDRLTRQFDLARFYNSTTLWVTSKWRREEKMLDLSRLRNERGELVTDGGTFLVPTEGSYMAVIEYGRSHPHTRQTESFGVPSSISIPVGQRAQMLTLLYASEVESRLTGSEVGWLRLKYADGKVYEIPLEVGKQIDTLYSHFASETMPLEIGKKGDSIHVLRLPCDPLLELEVLEIGLFAADVSIGLMGINVIVSGDDLQPTR
jgi:hypothetical protein